MTTAWAALRAQLPVDLGRSDGVVVTQEMVDVHAATTGDAQWIHNDPDRARRESPFGGPIVQGFLLMSLFTRLSAQLTFPAFGPVAMLVNYGFERVRFVRAVPVGAAVWMAATLAEVRPRDDGAAVLAVDVELRADTMDAAAGEDGGSEQHGPPVAVARWLFLAVPAPERHTNTNS